MDTALLERARSLAPLIEAEAAATEAAGTLTAPVVDALHDTSLFALHVPQVLGGPEADAETALAVYEELCRADGSTGWSLLANATSTGFAAVFTSDDAARTMFANRRVSHAGQYAPRGTAVREGHEFVVNGSYSFGSGSGHADWMGGGTVELRDGQPVLVDGRPMIRAFFVPRDHVVFRGNWDVMGLVGTGSYDYAVHDEHVDEGFTFDLIGAEPLRGGPTYHLGVLGLTSIGHAGFALGVGRRALDEVMAIAAGKQRMGAVQRLADQQRFQYELGYWDGALGAARAFCFDVFGDAQQTVDAGIALAAEQHQRLRQATTYATKVAADVVRFAYTFAGTDALRSPSALGRCFRDIHAGTQHIFVDDSMLVQMAQLLLAGGAGPAAPGAGK